MISHISTIAAEEREDKYNLVEDILSASNYYEALGLPDDSSFDEIRRAYIRVLLRNVHLQRDTDACVCCTHRRVEYAIQINSYHLIPKQQGVFKVNYSLCTKDIYMQ